MTWKELERMAVERGYEFVKHGGKHDIYKNPQTGSRIMIERHWSQEVRPGLMRALLKEMGK